MHIVWLHIRTIFIFYQSPQSRLRSEYCLSRGCFYWLLSSHHAHNTSFDYQSFPCHGVSGLQDFETEHSLSEEKPKNIIGTIFWFKFLKVWQTRREGKSRGFLNSLTKSFSRLKVPNWLTKKSFIQFGVSSYPHFKSPP